MEAVPGKHSIDSLQKTAILGTSHIIRKVLQCEILSLSCGDHRWFKRSTGEKRPVTRDIINNNNNNNNNNNSYLLQSYRNSAKATINQNKIIMLIIIIVINTFLRQSGEDLNVESESEVAAAQDQALQTK